MAGIFFYDAVLMRLKINFKLSFTKIMLSILFWSCFNKVSKHVCIPSIAPSNPHNFGILTTGAVARLVANSPNIEPRVRLSLIFPSSADLRKARCQLLTKRMGTRY